MVPVERPKTNKKFASREKIRKWKTGLRSEAGNGEAMSEHAQRSFVLISCPSISVDNAILAVLPL